MKNKTDQLYLKKFGQRIKELRHIKSISQEELADQAGVHRTYIGMIERGEKNITLISMLKLTNALSITMSNLFKDFENGE